MHARLWLGLANNQPTHEEPTNAGLVHPSIRNPPTNARRDPNVERKVLAVRYKRLGRHLLERFALYADVGRRDAYNRVVYGRSGPRAFELLMLDPATINLFLRRFPGSMRDISGCVAPGDWDLDVAPITKWVKYQRLHAHFCDGVSWEQTGVFEHMMRVIAKKGVHDGCRTIDDVRRRYERLDRLYARVRQEGRLQVRREVEPSAFRESGGISIHFTRTGEGVFRGGGGHRLCIAKILDLPVVPVCVGYIHRDAVHVWRSGCLAVEPHASANGRRVGVPTLGR
jgi:hypothetical protein